jgi:predicted aconitase with swiveling domain
VSLPDTATTFAVARALGPSVEAPALVSPVPFSARYDLDRDTGVVSRAGHPLRGASIAGAIFVCPAVQGGVAAGWTFLKLAALGVGVRGLVFGRTNPVMVQGAQAAGIPIVAGIDPAFFDVIRTGMVIRLEPAARQVVLVS